MTLLRKFFENRFVQEGLALSAVVFATIIELSHIASTGWLKLYLYNSDSLTLPILKQSLENKEEIQWVFSSQLLLFPEGVLYAFSSIFTQSVSTSLVMNSFVNIILLYVLVRLILNVATKISAQRQRLYGVLATSLVLLFMIMEQAYPSNSSQGMVSFFMFNTYYNGLILCGLFILYITLRQLKSKARLLSRANIGMTIIVAVTTMLTVASDPLYGPQITVPLISALLVFYIFKYAPRSKIIFLVLLQVVSTGLGLFMRLFLGAFIGQSLGEHNVQRGLNMFERMLAPLGALAPPNPTSSMRLRVILSVVAGSVLLFYVLIKMNQKLKNKKIKLEPISFFVFLFIAIEPIVLAFTLSVLSGVQTRYMITPIILSVVGLTVLIATLNINKVWRYFEYGIIIVIVSVSLFGIISIPRIRPLISAGFDDTVCLAEVLNHQPSNGIGDYWTARALDVYGQKNIRVLQAGSYEPFAWLNNLATYNNKEFSFIVVPRNPVQNIIHAPQNDLGDIGKPTSVAECPNFWVYQYAPGSTGYIKMNKYMQSSLKEQLELRFKGRIADYQ